MIFSSVYLFVCMRFLISMLLNWVSFLAYPNLFGTKGFVVVVVVVFIYRHPVSFGPGQNAIIVF
jgi:hypothetical protein